MAKEKREPIIIQKPDFRNLKVKIRGITPLQVHRLGKKLQQEFEDRDQNKPKKKKGPRDYGVEFLDSLYYIDENNREIAPPKKITAKTRFGFPASGIKKAMVYAARQYDNLKMTELKGRFFVIGEFIHIQGTPEIDKFWRRIGGKGPGTGTPDIGIRAVFKSWSSEILFKYNADVISAESVANLLATAGQAVGIGEDRPDKNGNSYGQWEII